MVKSWAIVYTKAAQKDAKKFSSAGLRSMAEGLLAILARTHLIYRCDGPRPSEKTGAEKREAGDASESLKRDLSERDKSMQRDEGSGLRSRSKPATIYEMSSKNPYLNPPPYEKLNGDLSGAYSRRITIQYRLVYQVLEREHVVKVLRIWTHYE